jgi:hypothetical protein
MMATASQHGPTPAIAAELGAPGELAAEERDDALRLALAA